MSKSRASDEAIRLVVNKQRENRRIKMMHQIHEAAVQVEEDDPCCLLYKQFYPQDHEYDCPKAVAAR